MTAPELKPCPFCGRGAEFSLGKTGDGKDWHYTECVNCGATGPLVNYADHNIAINDALVDAWNSRADLAAVQPVQPDHRDEVIARLVEALEGYKSRSRRIPFDLAVSSDAALAAAKEVQK